MRVAVDGLIYETESRGGISRLYSEILPRMCAMDESLKITLLTADHLRQPLPTHPHIAHRSYIRVDRVFRPWRLWAPAYPSLRRHAVKLAAGPGRGRIWHSTYYTVPTGWNGSTVVTVVDMIHERFAPLFNTQIHDRFRKVKKQCVLGADRVICISRTTQQDVQRFFGIDPERTEVVSLACSDRFRVIEAAADLTGLPTTGPYLLYVGTRRYHKNFAILLEAYSRWDRRTDIGLVIVGAPWSGEEVRLLEALGIVNQVHLVAYADDERLCQLYNQASAFVYPSLYEGFGIPLLEAMACGCPIIASRIPSTLEVAQECPIYFAPTEADDLIAAFDVAIKEGRDSERVRRGVQLSKRFSWDETARQTLEVYRALSNPD